jgi:hypothetical protein
MTKRLLLATVLGLAACGAIADAAVAKGVGAMPAPGGVIVPGGEDRYIAISPRIPRATTVVARVKRDGGKLGRWWYLRGTWFVPAVAYDLSPGGLSADGGTLVLQRFNRTYPPPSSRFAILDTERSFEWGRPGRASRFRRFFDHVDLRGDYSFDAISPDGSTVYLIHRYLPPSSGGSYITNYEVRALDVESGELLPQPIIDPEEPDERMQGLPITRAASPDGRWAYTLYDGNGDEPFIHALDTVGRRAACIDLPQLERRRNIFMLRMRIEQHGQRLTVLSGPRPPRALPPLAKGRPIASPAPRPLLSVDTQSFEVETARGGADSGGGRSLPWLSLGLAGVGLCFALSWLARRRRTAVDEQLETT